MVFSSESSESCTNSVLKEDLVGFDGFIRGFFAVADEDNSS